MSDVINAAKRGDMPTLKRLTQGNKNILGTTNSEGYFALYWAACCGHEDVCRYILESGAEVDQTVKTGSSALHAAADRGHIECVQILVNSNCDMNLQNYNNFDTPLHLAAFRGHLEICRFLVKSGASLSIKNVHGKAPVDEASTQQHQEVASYLYESWQKEMRRQPRTTTVYFTAIRGNTQHSRSNHKRTSSDPKFSYHKSSKTSTSPPEHRANISKDTIVPQATQAYHQSGYYPTLSSINSSNGEVALEQDYVDGSLVQSNQSGQLLKQGVVVNEDVKQVSSSEFNFLVHDRYPINRSHKEDIYFCPHQNQRPIAVQPQHDFTRPCANENTSSSSYIPNIAQEEVNKPRHTQGTTFNQSHPHGKVFADTSNRNSASLNRSNIPMSKLDSENSTFSDNSSSVTDSDFSLLSSGTQNEFDVISQSQIGNNAPSQNFPTSPKPNHSCTIPYRHPHADYISSLEIKVTTQRDRISFLENKNAILWQECEDLRALKSGDKQASKQNQKLKQQVHVLLQEVDELRQHLKSSESRSKHLAKQLFQRFQNNNNNHIWSSSSVKNSSNSTVCESHLSREHKETKYDSDHVVKQLKEDNPTIFKTPQKDKSKLVTRKKKRRTSRTRDMQGDQSPSTQYSGPPSPAYSSSSGTSGSRDSPLISPTSGLHIPLMETLGPLFLQAGPSFVTDASDRLRQAVTRTLPNVKERSLDLSGKRWQMGEDYVLVDEEPINEISPGEIEGACSLVYRIKHQERTYILKMMINLVNLARGGHEAGHSRQLFLFQQFSAEYTVPFALPPHRNIIQVLHHFNAATLDFRGALRKVIPEQFDVPIDMANETSFIVLPEYSTTLKRLLDRRVEITRKKSAGCQMDVSSQLAIPEEFIAQKLFEVLSAVNHLSENKIVHRDIKADNIFLDHSLGAVLGDFGMARNLRAPDGEPIAFVESDQVVAGNSLAWAPELIHWHAQGPSKEDSSVKVLDDVYAYSDVYAVGVMFSSLITSSISYDPMSVDLESSGISPGLKFILQRLVAPIPYRLSAMKAMTMVGLHMFGPSLNEVSSEDDCAIWLQAKMMKLLVCQGSMPRQHTSSDSTCTVATSINRMRDLLEREYVTKIRAKDLFACYQEYCAAVSDMEDST